MQLVAGQMNEMRRGILLGQQCKRRCVSGGAAREIEQTVLL